MACARATKPRPLCERIVIMAIATKVIDASALAAALFDEESAESVAAQVVGCQLVAPQLLEFDLVNICVKKIRRSPSKERCCWVVLNDGEPFGSRRWMLNTQPFLRLLSAPG